ncbi:alpha/beta hydrolase [Rhodococcus chondri]|uniref:Alpha/beta hydrolase n=1 Tax=Rhodococcus chondri TaxID=3065941 RepID=A0ABU7JSS5_9NOCA|nr:alpha/beta hydrolase [Rhodococcus sp. CC-R104]MEE2033083.1 alpha/beta hydrolase [Rhodococcus sp. CC-R104]
MRSATRALAKPVVGAWMARPDLAWPLTLVDSAAGLLPRPANAQYLDVDLGECSAEWVRAHSKSTSRVVLYLHGGAFLMGGLNTHRALAVALSDHGDCPVLNVDYRMLPTAPIGHAVEDAVRGYKWLRDKGYRGEDIVVAGDSAGGYLAFMTALAIAESEMSSPAGILALSPLIDTDVDRRAARDTEVVCPMFPDAAVDSLVQYIQATQTRLVVEGEPGPLVCPLDNDLSVLPPVMIHAGEDELLRSDAEAMAEQVRAAGVSCDLHLWRRQVHAFPVFADVLPESRRALRSAGQFVRTVTGTPAPNNTVAADTLAPSTLAPNNTPSNDTARGMEEASVA